MCGLLENLSTPTQRPSLVCSLNKIFRATIIILLFTDGDIRETYLSALCLCSRMRLSRSALALRLRERSPLLFARCESTGTSSTATMNKTPCYYLHTPLTYPTTQPTALLQLRRCHNFETIYITNMIYTKNKILVSEFDYFSIILFGRIGMRLINGPGEVTTNIGTQTTNKSNSQVFVLSHKSPRFW